MEALEKRRRAGATRGKTHKPLDFNPQTSRRGRAARWTIAASVVLTLGVAAFHWQDELTEYARTGIAAFEAPTDDLRARAPSGEARLLLDQSLEQFSSRLDGRAKATPSGRPAAAADRPSSSPRNQSEEG